MSLPGKVTEVFETTVTVEVSPRTECKGCHACSGLAGGGENARTRTIKAFKGSHDVQPGDMVLLDLNPGEGSVAAMLVFGFPMAAFFAGLFAAPAICATAGIEVTDMLRVLSGFLGMAVAFMILAVISRTRHAERLQMKVIRKLEASELNAACELKQTD